MICNIYYIIYTYILHACVFLCRLGWSHLDYFLQQAKCNSQRWTYSHSALGDKLQAQIQNMQPQSKDKHQEWCQDCKKEQGEDTVWTSLGYPWVPIWPKIGSRSQKSSRHQNAHSDVASFLGPSDKFWIKLELKDTSKGTVGTSLGTPFRLRDTAGSIALGSHSKS